MANPTISQITIGSNTYDICDATARNLAIPKIHYVQGGWRSATVANGVNVHSNQIIETGHFPGTMFFYYGLQSEVTSVNKATPETWGQYYAYIASTATNAGSDFNIGDQGNGAAIWSPIQITHVKIAGAGYGPCRVHTEATDISTNFSNFWRRRGGVQKTMFGADSGLNVTITSHFTGVYLYMPSTINDYTKVFSIATTTQQTNNSDILIYTVWIQENDTDI